MRHTMSVVICFAFLGAGLRPEVVEAAPILQINAGILTGATGVDLGGTLYDVEFVEGDCFSVFSPCINPADFDFQTEDDAVDAAQALLDQVFVNQFDTSPGLIFGCAGNDRCDVLMPYASLSLTTIFVGSANNFSGVDDLAGPSLFPTTLHTKFLAGVVYADWSPAAITPVPAPATMLLLGTGFAGLAVRRYRRQQS
jgi:hypothetical protein